MLEEMQVVRPVGLDMRFKAQPAIDEFRDGFDRKVFDGAGARAFELEGMRALGNTMHGFACWATSGGRVNRNFSRSGLVQRQTDSRVTRRGEREKNPAGGGTNKREGLCARTGATSSSSSTKLLSLRLSGMAERP